MGASSGLCMEEPLAGCTHTPSHHPAVHPCRQRHPHAPNSTAAPSEAGTKCPPSPSQDPVTGRGAQTGFFIRFYLINMK